MDLIDPDTPIIRDVCQKLVGASIQLRYTITLSSEDHNKDYTQDITNCNIIGDCMENIIIPFLKNRLPTFEEGPKQASPDFYNRNKAYEWELKVFTGNSPGFDISNFISYIHQLDKDVVRKLYKTQYLIFKYSTIKNVIRIDDFKICNVWDLIMYNGKYPISLQNKKGIWYNIRPGGFKEMNNNKTADLFIKSICKAIMECPNRIDNREQLILNITKQFNECVFAQTLNTINTQMNTLVVE